MRRLLSAWLPYWPTLRLRRQQRDGAPERPLATVGAVHGARRLTGVDPLAEAAGLQAGMALAQARAICPGLDLAASDPAADAAALASLAAWCTRYTPLAAADPPDGLLLDITGCGPLFGGEAALAADLQARLRRGGLPARLAVAGSAVAARALARAAAEAAVTVLPPGGEPAALAPLPVGLLRLDPRDAAGLVRLGVGRVGELARLPRAELAARFGAGVLRHLDQAVCAAPEPLVWPHPAPPWRAGKDFAEPIATPDDLVRALALLAGRLCARLAAARLGGQRFEAEFFRLDGARPAIAVATALPVRDPAYVTKLLAARLEAVDPGFGVDRVALAAVEVAPLAPQQVQLDAWAGATPALAASLDALALRLGEGRVWRPAPEGSHVPERSLRRAPPLAPAAAWREGPPRPVRLLRRPEPVAAVAPVPDDPPLMFRWRGTLHRVRAASGPERIAAEWWRRRPEPGERPPADLVRDYYRVEDMAGGRFWLFRTGRNAGSPGTRWFLHGLFG